jgi:hypothetical protein
LVEPQADRINSIENAGPGEIFLQLLESDEFRLRFADRIQTHLFNGGVLTPENNVRRMDELAAIVDRAVVGESARWGDAWMNQVNPPRTRDDDWLSRLEVLRSEYFPQRNATVIQQYRQRGLYPLLDAPQFSQHGGTVEPGATVGISHPSAGVEIYVTRDGSDPRDAAGGMAPTAQRYTGEPLMIQQDQLLQARAWDGNEWSARIQASFFVRLPGDVNHDSQVDAADIDDLCRQIRGGVYDAELDLNQDAALNELDHQHLVEQILDTSAGDTNLDGIFNPSDLIDALAAGLYEDAVEDNAGWSSGDWDCDGDFGTGDLVAAFQTGRYVAEARPAVNWTAAVSAAVADVENTSVGGFPQSVDVRSANITGAEGAALDEHHPLSALCASAGKKSDLA